MWIRMYFFAMDKSVCQLECGHERSRHSVVATMGQDIEPRRLALRFQPPAIVVEYARREAYHTQLYHHVIDLREDLTTSSVLSEWAMKDIVDRILEQHASVLGDVSAEQLKRLIKKLASRNDSASSTTKTVSDVRDAAPVAAAVLPQADYNRVSETQLRQVKQRMDTVFQQNILRPGDHGYQYDKQVTFQPSEEASDWDD